ncbi:MAG: hypothetical protein U0793_16575 [Gemmataceae bacterium]
MLTLIMPPKSRCFFARSCPDAPVGRDSQIFAIAGCFASAQPAAALRQWRSSRRDIFQPANTRYESNGPGTPPAAFW